MAGCTLVRRIEDSTEEGSLVLHEVARKYVRLGRIGVVLVRHVPARVVQMAQGRQLIARKVCAEGGISLMRWTSPFRATREALLTVGLELRAIEAFLKPAEHLGRLG